MRVPRAAGGTMGGLRECSSASSASPPTLQTAAQIVKGYRDDIFKRYPPQPGGVARYAWVETLDAEAPRTGSTVRLHPEVWSVQPCLDIIKANLDWQLNYKHMSYEHVKSRHEMPPPPRPGRPWPQKGMGRARHSSWRSPIFFSGGKAHGPRGVKTWYYNLEYSVRVNGLIQCLAVKFAQDDVHIVQDLEIPTGESKYIEDLVDDRCWEITTLFVDDTDIFPENITKATDDIFHMNLMPVYGLNVHSLLKHKTLVLTLPALEKLEEKLIFAHRRLDVLDKRLRSNDPAESIYKYVR